MLAPQEVVGVFFCIQFKLATYYVRCRNFQNCFLDREDFRTVFRSARILRFTAKLGNLAIDEVYNACAKHIPSSSGAMYTYAARIKVVFYIYLCVPNTKLP